MRLDSLHLRPYGTLSDQALELGEGMTVVHGLNEAGKSTLLSAYADLLCGIPRQTPMAFEVPRAKLRLQAGLTMDDGSTVTVVRTARNAPNDLLDAATSQPVSAGIRHALTQALDHDNLLTRFGLDHERLIAGGRKLVGGKGGLADIVFEARSGADVRALVDRLDSRVTDLYTPRKNSKSELIQAHDERAELDGKLKHTVATAEAVEAAAGDRHRAEAELERRRREAASLRTDHDRLTKLRDSWRYWQEYRVRRDELAQAEARGPRLTPDQLDAVTDAVGRLAEIDDEIGEQKDAAATAELERSGLAVDEKLLDAQPAIDTLIKDKHRADEARAREAELGRDAADARAALVKLLVRLGGHDDAEPLATLATIVIPDDRTVDLNGLAAEGDQLDDTARQARQSVADAADAVEAAEQAVQTARPSDAESGSADPTQLHDAREKREVLWGHVRRSWLTGEAVPIEIGSEPAALANRYEEAVADTDGAADELIAEAGRLSQQQRKQIAAAASAQATVGERRRALSKAEQVLADVERAQADWQSRWLTVAEAAGLADGLGVAGWRERAGLLSQAQAAADDLSDLDRQKSAKAQTAAGWDAAASALAAVLGRPVGGDQLVAWFDATAAAYQESKANRKAAEVHRQAQNKAVKRIARLCEERATLEGTLERVAADCGADRSELSDLAERTRTYQAAEEELKSAEAELTATHPASTLGELIDQLTDRDAEQLGVDVASAQEALEQAENAVNDAQGKAIEARKIHDELTGRTGADVLQQQLSQATARVLDIVEEYVTTRLMHRLLTGELHAYLESHRNPVLERAGSYLSRLTQGRFIGLRADGDGADRSLIVIGADDTDYETAALSEGTACQLYLALSLAGVLEVEQERRRAGQEAVPIMLDDVLMAFDDERAASALDLLAEIGSRQQIVLFTHHGAVKEQAGSVAGAVSVVSLASPASRV